MRLLGRTGRGAHLQREHHEGHADHDDHQQLGRPDLGGDVAVAHRGEGDDAEVEGREERQVLAGPLQVLDAAGPASPGRQGRGRLCPLATQRLSDVSLHHPEEQGPRHRQAPAAWARSASTPCRSQPGQHAGPPPGLPFLPGGSFEAPGKVTWSSDAELHGASEGLGSAGVAWAQAVSHAGHPGPQGLIITQEVGQRGVCRPGRCRAGRVSFPHPTPSPCPQTGVSWWQGLGPRHVPSEGRPMALWEPYAWSRWTPWLLGGSGWITLWTPRPRCLCGHE